MTPQSVDRMIARDGESCILRRLTGTAQTTTDVPLKAKIATDAVVQMEGSAEQASGTARLGNLQILAAAWPAPIREGDQLIRFPDSASPKPLTIVLVDTKMLGDEVAMWVLSWVG